jgi:hypothetical protein
MSHERSPAKVMGAVVRLRVIDSHRNSCSEKQSGASCSEDYRQQRLRSRARIIIPTHRSQPPGLRAAAQIQWDSVQGPRSGGCVAKNYLSVAPFGAGVSSLDAFLGLTPQAIFWSPPHGGLRRPTEFWSPPHGGLRRPTERSGAPRGHPSAGGA